MTLSIEAIPVLETNYVWCLHDGADAVVVDPGEAGPVLEWLEGEGLALRGILITHHHGDHTGGIDGILDRHRVPVFGPRDERIPQVDHAVAEGDRVALSAPPLDLEVIDVPGHTSIHIAFYGHDLLLCGDALFSAGCGRVFEGTPAQLCASLDKLAALPGRTRVCCAHEYTLANCRFALEVEPENTALERRAREVAELRAAGRITLPSTIEAERAFNPFLRVREPSVIEAARRRQPGCGESPEEVFAVLRGWKDSL